MKFLIDENLSPRVADLLTRAGHESVHVRDIDAAGEPDRSIMTRAADGDQVIISADTDFGALLAHDRASKPSVVLVREIVDLRPHELVGVILAQLGTIDDHLSKGAIVAISRTSVRVRDLPLR